MIIYATFVNFTYDSESCELAHAWDEYARDNNPAGYEDTLKDVLKSYSDELAAHVTVEINVDSETIAGSLAPKVRLEGHVKDGIPA